jgi:hypothetical protein
MAGCAKTGLTAKDVQNIERVDQKAREGSLMELTLTSIHEGLALK